jgi:hypothetical protein
MIGLWLHGFCLYHIFHLPQEKLIHFTLFSFSLLPQLHTYTNYFRITNNGIISNSGSFAGGIRVGTAFLPSPYLDGSGNSHNSHLTISGNSIKFNGGFGLAGAIGLFGGSDHYVVHNNYICGNAGKKLQPLIYAWFFPFLST